MCEADTQDRPNSPSAAADPSVPRGRCYPFHELPFDVVFLVFDLLVCPSDQEPAKHVVLASHVCRAWRNLALQMPTLWNRLIFTTFKPNLEKYAEWIQRSQDAPLFIKMASPCFQRAAVKTIAGLLRILLPHSQRWKTLNLVSIPPKITTIILQRLRQSPNLGMLEELEVTRNRGGEGTYRLPLGPLDTPRLKSFLVPGIDVKLSHPIITNLREITLSELSFNRMTGTQAATTIRDILTRSPHLEHLKINLETFWDPTIGYPQESTPFPLIIHENIKSLTVGLPISCYPTVHLFLSVKMPQLSVLSSHHMHHCLFLPTLCSFNTFSNLTEFRLSGMVITACPYPAHYLLYLPQAFRKLPSVRKISFRQVDFGDNQWIPDLATSCPKLVDLAFEECSGFTIRAIIDLASKRREAPDVTPLEAISVTNYPAGEAVPEDLQAQLRHVLPRGLYWHQNTPPQEPTV